MMILWDNSISSEMTIEYADKHKAMSYGKERKGYFNLCFLPPAALFRTS